MGAELRPWLPERSRRTTPRTPRQPAEPWSSWSYGSLLSIRMKGQTPSVRLIRCRHRETCCPAYPDWRLLRFRGGFERFDKGARSAEWESRDVQRFQLI